MVKKRLKKQNKYDKYLLLSWKRFGLIILAWFVTVILHNVCYAIFHFEEGIFFTLAGIIIPVYFIISAIYSLVKIILKGFK